MHTRKHYCISYSKKENQKFIKKTIDITNEIIVINKSLVISHVLMHELKKINK